MKTIKILAIIAVFAFGANMNAQKRVTQRVTSVSADQTTQQKNNVSIDGMNITKSITMNGGTLRVEGANNTITVKGFADKVMIEGANVIVRIDRVNSVKLEGANTKVYYKASGGKNGKPAVSVFGMGSGVVKVN